MTPGAIEFVDVYKTFGTSQVLRGLSFQVSSGELCALVGANGAGKTTAIKSLLDFCSTDAGHISIFGTPQIHADARSRLAFLPARFAPPYYLTGAEYLHTTAQLYDVPFSHDTASSMCSALELDLGALKRLVRTYSKGMAQKLGLAATFLSQRELLVLDEPLSGLDPKARILVKAQLQRLREAGRTVFFSSHMLADVEALCDRMCLLHEGRVVFEGTIGAWLERYATRDLETAFLRAIEPVPTDSP